MLADLDLSLWWERSVTPAWGAAGGQPGAAPQVTINPGTEDEVSLLKANSRRIERGTIVRCESGGGGGFGDPAERDRTYIDRDVSAGYVSPRAAEAWAS